MTLLPETTSWGPSSALFPGAVFTFITGPPVPYDLNRRFRTNPAGIPRGEDTGFRVGSVTVAPSGGQGLALPITLAPFERFTGVLTGPAAGTGSEDSVYMVVAGTQQSSVSRTLAIWQDTQYAGAGSAQVYARCGAKPTRTTWTQVRTFSVLQPAFIELGACVSGWHVVVASTTNTAPMVFHGRIGEHFANAPPNNVAEHRVGIEFATTGPAEDAWIRSVLRLAAWRAYGSTGGTQLIRAFRYNVPGGCSNVRVCVRNRPGPSTCAQGTGFAMWDPINWNAHLCYQPDTSPAGQADSIRAASAILAHEFQHLWPRLNDEYWRSSDLAKICGVSGVLIMRCNHSMMSATWSPLVNSLCTDRTHGRSTEFLLQPTIPGAFPLRTGAVRGLNTIAECWDNSVTQAGPWGGSAWSEAAASDVPSRHPNDLSPDNFDFQPFAAGPGSIASLGVNLN